VAVTPFFFAQLANHLAAISLSLSPNLTQPNPHHHSLLCQAPRAGVLPPPPVSRRPGKLRARACRRICPRGSACRRVVEQRCAGRSRDIGATSGAGKQDGGAAGLLKVGAGWRLRGEHLHVGQHEAPQASRIKPAPDENDRDSDSPAPAREVVGTAATPTPHAGQMGRAAWGRGPMLVPHPEPLSFHPYPLLSTSPTHLVNHDVANLLGSRPTPACRYNTTSSQKLGGREATGSRRGEGEGVGGF
jgi:hypothetical protein